jgi:DNA-binding CsgD family transcriptional regulator
MVNLAQFIEASNEIGSIDELYRLLERVIAHECGYDRVIFSLMSDHTSLRLSAGHGIMRNYPDDWMKHYIEHGYEHLDPVRRFGFRHVGPFIWDQLPLVMDLSPRQQLCLNMGREAGLHNGAAICLRGILGENAGIGGASSSNQGKLSDKDLKHRLSLLNVISHQFYVVFCALHKRRADFPESQVELTVRELQIIRLMAAAKSDGVISDILSISPSAVNFHARSILRKFGVSNRITAVMKAVHSGIVGPDEAVFLRKP